MEDSPGSRGSEIRVRHAVIGRGECWYATGQAARRRPAPASLSRSRWSCRARNSRCLMRPQKLLGADRELSAAAHAELFEHRMEIDFDGAFGDPELLGDFTI